MVNVPPKNPDEPEAITKVKEREWTDSIGTALLGIGIMLIAGLLMYSVQFWVQGATLQMVVRILMGLGVFVGAGILGLAIYRSLEVRKAPGVAFTCPFCDQPMMFTDAPHADFDCEHCNRTVHFQNGHPIPVRTIICQACRTEHRVPINVTRYVCDRCNRPLKLSADPTQQLATMDDKNMVDAMLQNYDVLLLAIDRRQENEIALKLQSIMVVTLADARKLMLGATNKAPLTVSTNQPQRKADAIKRQLQELGATVTLRASATIPPPKRK